jgi:hypothetical protein
MNVKETTINERFVVEKFTTKKFHELLQVQSTKKATIAKELVPPTNILVNLEK